MAADGPPTPGPTPGLTPADGASAPGPTDTGTLGRIRRWVARAGIGRGFTAALGVAAVALAFGTFIVLSDERLGSDPNVIYSLIGVDLLFLLPLGLLVARRIVRLWGERRRGLAGSKLQVRLLLLFGGLAAAPAIIVAGFSGLFLSLGLENWFSQRVRAALDESQAVAEAYLEEHRNTIRSDIIAMATDISREGPSLLADPYAFGNYFAAQTALRSLNEAVMFTDQGQVVARAGMTLSLEIGGLPLWAVERARRGEVVPIGRDPFDTEAQSDDRVRALIYLERFSNIYLLVGRFVDERAVSHVERHREAIASYANLGQRLFGLQVTFAMIFSLVTLLLVLAAVWVGLLVGNRLLQPIAALITAAERIRSGDLAVRVAEEGNDDELATLSRAFNRMTSQLEAQRGALIAANRALDDRRRFTESVLSGVSAGVIGLDAAGHINLPNRSASTLLSDDLEARIGQPFDEAVPEMKKLLDAARASPERVIRDEVVLQRDGRRRRLIVRVAPERVQGGTTGFVVTFDDITELEQAQRQAAWADVARRIAHEIKNPLTPIQLSAERLKRKYLAEIRSDPETFRICIETIVRQVGDIGRMVDEFSSFARMPAPVMRADSLADIVHQAVFLHRNARAHIAFAITLPPQPIKAMVDARLVGQALTNLLQNAVDAIEGRDHPAEGQTLPQGRIEVTLARDEARAYIIVADNGRGLPTENRERLTEPYVTTRAKGTGLGLAIVKKIMEDHGGVLILEDRPEGGARVSLTLPALGPLALDPPTAGSPSPGASTEQPETEGSDGASTAVKALAHGA
jgi:two-component system nitrogen regulation sensor histidine kinase NtrY